jgi:hypothetical protein
MGATIGRETVIENAIIEHPDMLGFPGASAIRNWAVAPAGGRLDLGLFPVSGPVRLVLIEAKAACSASGRCLDGKPKLADRFGGDYEEYCRHVPRLVPRPRPWTGRVQ